MSTTIETFDVDHTPVKAKPPSNSPTKSSSSSYLSSNRGLRSPTPSSARAAQSPAVLDLPSVGKILIQRVTFSHFNGTVIEKMSDVYAKVGIVGADTEVKTTTKSVIEPDIDFTCLDLSLGVTSSSLTLTLNVSLWKKIATSVDILVAAGVIELKRAIRSPNVLVDLTSIVTDNGKDIATVSLGVLFAATQPEQAVVAVTPAKLSPRPYSASSSLWKLTLHSLEAKDLFDTSSKAIKQSPAVTVKIGTQSLTTARAVDAGTSATYSEQLVYYFEKNQFTGLQMEVEVSHLTSRDRKLYEIGSGKLPINSFVQAEQDIVIPLMYAKKNQPAGLIIAKGRLESVERRPGTKYDAVLVVKDPNIERALQLESIVLALNKDSEVMSEQLSHLSDDIVILRGFQEEMNKLLREQGALLASMMD